ncbi:MAG: hypothetical protein ACLP0J_09175 [Solirubrobacteraceae bacterium]
MDSSLVELFRGTITVVKCKGCQRPLPVTPTLVLIYPDCLYWVAETHSAPAHAALQAQMKEIAREGNFPRRVEQLSDYRALLQIATQRILPIAQQLQRWISELKAGSARQADVPDFGPEVFFAAGLFTTTSLRHLADFGTRTAAQILSDFGRLQATVWLNAVARCVVNAESLDAVLDRHLVASAILGSSLF